MEICGVERRKVLQYCCLFSLLVFIYAFGLSSYLESVFAKADAITGLGDLYGPLVRFCILSALPFAALAYSDKSWRSRDAARVCAVAWIVAADFMHRNHTYCALLLYFPFLPFIASATVAHAAGRATRFVIEKAVSPRPVSS